MWLNSFKPHELSVEMNCRNPLNLQMIANHRGIAYFSGGVTVNGMTDLATDLIEIHRAGWGFVANLIK
jgi:hypothetical protein